MPVGLAIGTMMDQKLKKRKAIRFGNKNTKHNNI
jgi:hypothetical protein